MVSLCEEVLQLEEELSIDLLTIAYSNPPVYCIYNPVQYASIPHKIYLERCFEANNATKVLLVGMNPGPYGMCQTGVPFGDVSMVTNYLGITGTVCKPNVEHPKKAVLGFGMARKEVSGTRFWSLIQTLTDECVAKFYRSCYVHNYCPLAFLASSGKNITPPALPKKELKMLQQKCDESFAKLISLLKPVKVIAIGKYAYDRTKTALTQTGLESEIEVGTVVNHPHVNLHLLCHPSPINPANNKPPGWAHVAAQLMHEWGVTNILSQ